jgi:hypothetical protein
MNGSNYQTNRMARSVAALIGVVALLTSSPWVFAAPDSNAWGDDPFGAPPGATSEPGTGAEQESMSPVELQGIIAGPGGMVAIVDDRVVRIGDRLGAELVEEITPRAVILRHGPNVRRLVLSVFPTRGR